MEIEISQKTIDETTECEHSHECLKDVSKIHCKVESEISGEVHFVKCPDEELCAYKQTFGHSQMCCCPIRKEIYNKYKV